MRSAHSIGTRALSAAMALIGVVLVVQALGAQAGMVLRLALGVLFVAAGAGRLYVEARRGRRT